MSRVLVYTTPARGHLFPLVPTLLALRDHGHEVHVRTLAAEGARLRALGLHASALSPAVEGRALDDWKARTPIEAARRTYTTFLDRAEAELPDLREATDSVQPEVHFVDVNAWGALAFAEASGRPHAVFAPFLLPVRVPGRPPFGMGLAPLRGPLGRLRDALLWAVSGWVGRPALRRLNGLRAGLGLGPLGGLHALTAAAPRVIAYTAEPFEYDHGGWPANVHFVGPGLWEPDAAGRADDVPGGRPLVLVTGSTEFQDDGALLRTALAALAEEPVDVVVTTGATDPAELGPPPANAAVTRFAAHGPLLRRAVAVVCHGGMGITQKALAAGVPVCVVPWGRDQHDVARHVEQAGAGRRLPRERLDPARLREAVRATMGCAAGARRVAEGFAGSGGAAAAARLIEELVDPAGAARREARPAGG